MDRGEEEKRRGKRKEERKQEDIAKKGYRNEEGQRRNKEDESKGRKKRDELKKKKLKICFWNVAGVMNKEEDIWRYLEEFVLIGLIKTWLEEEKWKKMKNKMSKEFIWWNGSGKGRKKGRAKGGILITARREIEGICVREINKQVAEVDITHNKNKWKIFVIYSQNVEEIIESIKEEVPEEEEDYIMIRGDFNARTGIEGGQIVYEEEKREKKRRSKGKVINKEGRVMLNKLQERMDDIKREWRRGRRLDIHRRERRVSDRLCGNK